MPELHHRGVELLVDVLDAVEHVEKMSTDEVKTLLTEIGVVLGQLLERDIPEDHQGRVIAAEAAVDKPLVR